MMLFREYILEQGVYPKRLSQKIVVHMIEKLFNYCSQTILISLITYFYINLISSK